MEDEGAGVESRDVTPARPRGVDSVSRWQAASGAARCGPATCRVIERPPPLGAGSSGSPEPAPARATRVPTENGGDVAAESSASGSNTAQQRGSHVGMGRATGTRETDQ